MFELTNELLIQLLLFIIVFVITSQTLKRVFKDKTTPSIIALSVSLIATYYISNSQLDFLNITYSLTGIILLILIPFIIAFFFIYSSNINSLLRKMFWIFYGIIIIFLLQNKDILPFEISTLVTTLIIFLTIGIVLLDTIIKNKFNAIKNLKR
jgi:hypothetical protein|tara:strand:- start:428 stop:886 length:459 start_codon:yes stop_codon:yes gene_type:complete